MVTTLSEARCAALKGGLKAAGIGAAAGLGVSATYDAVRRLNKDEFLPQSLRKKDKPNVYFGMYKARLKEAERRKDRVFADADAGPSHKTEALEHYEQTAKLAQNAEGIAKNTEKAVRGATSLIGGVAGAAATTLSLGHIDPTVISEATQHALTTVGGIAGSVASAMFERDARKTIGDYVADRSDARKGVHYPSKTVKGVLEELANGKIDLKQGDHFYDHKGRKWKFDAPPEQVKKLQELAKEYNAERVKHEKALRELKAGTSFFKKDYNLEYKESSARDKMHGARGLMRSQIIRIKYSYMDKPEGYNAFEDEADSMEREGW